MRSAEASVYENDRTVSAGTLAGSATLPAGPRTATDGEARAATPLIRGNVVGRYVVLALIGSGGMGAVYAAHDPELDRKIALKLVRPGADPADGVRMLREARALAKLAHPNVVAVHDVGTVGAEADSVDLFIAMEFVDGVTVRQWLRERERPLREIVDVFAGAARGLAAAHRVGLVHRDFKPDNVMVAADGRARVMDFGLARAWSERETTLPDGSGGPSDMRLTRAGSRLGTPTYMAPEQWEGDEVDARTDQFAFCVALWEAVYGERPFRGETMQELMSSVTTGSIAKPPERRRGAPKWLARVMGRGLSRRPEQRFASMEALLAELERGIAQQRRRPLLAGVAGALVLAAGMLGLQARRAAGCEAEGETIAEVWHEGSQAALLQALRATGLPYAETSYHKAVPHIDRWTGEWSELRARVCKESRVDGSRTPESYKAAAACLDEQRDELAAVLEVFTAHPQANVQRLVSAVAGLAQLQPCAEQSYLERRPAPPDDPATRERVRALQKEVLLARGRLAAGDCGGLAQAEALEKEAEALGYRPLAVHAIDLVGDVAECNDDYARAEQALKKVYVEAEALRADELAAGAAIELVATIGLDRSRAAEALQWALPAEVIVQRLGQQRGLLGARLSQSKAIVLLSLGEHAKALAEMEGALAIREELLGGDHPAVASTLEMLGNIHRAREAIDAALAVQTRALQIRREALGADHPAVGISANNLGLLEQQRGNYDAAKALLAEAARVDEAALGPDDLEVATALNNLGRLQHVRGEYAEARALLERALEIREKKLGADALDVAVTLQNLGLLELIQGDRIAARSRLERVLKIRERKLDETHPELVAILDSLGTLNYRIGDYAQAEALHERALAIQRKILPAEHPDIASSLRNLALVRHARGAREEALALAREALAAAERALGPEHPDIAPFLNTLGLLQRRGDPAAAVATLERALAISARARGKRHPATATSLLRLGEAHLARGEYQAAQASLEEALSIRETLGMHTPEVAEALVGLGELALARGRASEAAPLFERALQIREKPGIPAHQLAEARFGLARALHGEPGRARSLVEQAAAGLRGDEAQREQAAAGLRGDEAQRELVAAIEAWLRAAPT